MVTSSHLTTWDRSTDSRCGHSPITESAGSTHIGNLNITTAVFFPAFVRTLIITFTRTITFLHKVMGIGCYWNTQSALYSHSSYHVTSLSPLKKNPFWSMSRWTSSSRGFVVRYIVSIDWISGHNNVGHQQIARFLLSMLCTALILDTLQQQQSKIQFIERTNFACLKSVRRILHHLLHVLGFTIIR